MSHDFFFNNKYSHLNSKSAFKKNKKKTRNNQTPANASLKNETVSAAIENSFIPPTISIETGKKEIPKSTIEKISPAYRLIKEAFTELQIFSRVCKLNLLCNMI